MAIVHTVAVSTMSELTTVQGEGCKTPALDTVETGSRDATNWIDPVAERKLVWKLDFHVVLPLAILFLLSFLDRTNIGM